MTPGPSFDDEYRGKLPDEFRNEEAKDIHVAHRPAGLNTKAAAASEVAPEGEQTLQIVYGLPPIWEEAKKHFDVSEEHTVFTYGAKIYNPGRGNIDQPLMAHESTHADQQLEFEGGPSAWWKKYFADPEFRLAEELIAYQHQYEYYCFLQHDRNRRAIFLNRIAGDLSSGQYKCAIDKAEAAQRIKATVRS